MKRRYQVPMIRTVRLEVNEILLAGSEREPQISNKYSDLALETETNYTVWDDLW